MDHITQKVYNYMKLLSDENGFAPTVRQTAQQLEIKESEVEDAIMNLQQSGKIVVTDIPAKSVIEVVNETESVT